MAAATYTTDLTTISDAESTTGYSEPTGSIAGGTPSLENEYFIQGSNCISKTFNATGVGGLAFTGANQTLPTDGAAYIWAYFTAPNALATKVNGGKQILVGSSAANYRRYYVAGNDTYTYGGWVCYPINPTVTASATQGTPTTSYNTFGFAANVTLSISRGNPLGLDVQRIGRGTLQVVNGDLANGYGNFLSAATQNDLVANRWGILSFIDGGYKFQGHFLMGTAATAVDFRDSNKNITIQNTEFVTSGFNSFEVRNASSIVEWIGINIQSLSTVSRGNFLVTNNANVDLISCSFTDLGTFTFLSNTTVDDCTFRRCSTLTHGNCTFTNNIITNSIATSAVVTTNPANIQNCQFISSGTGHGLEITTPGTYTFIGNTFTNYGSTGTTNAAVYNNSGGSVTLNITGGTLVTYRNGTGASTSVNATYVLTLTNIIAGTQVTIVDSSTRTELQNSIVDGTGIITYSHNGTGTIDILLINLSYDPTLSNVYDLVLTSENTSIKFQMIDDVNYANP